MFRELNPEKIIETIKVLNNRINERFPGSGLNQVCAELCQIATESRERALSIARPNMLVRIMVGVIISISILVLVYSSNYIKVTSEVFSWGELVQILEAAINNIILIGAALFFLVTFETRIKRKRALKALHELRAMSHVIDMHQLTKDPGRARISGRTTPSSPRVGLTTFELTRYLDYCSEMLSLIGKIAAFYADSFQDPVVISAVNEVETLTTQRDDAAEKLQGCAGKYGKK